MALCPFDIVVVIYQDVQSRPSLQFHLEPRSTALQYGRDYMQLMQSFCMP